MVVVSRRILEDVNSPPVPFRVTPLVPNNPLRTLPTAAGNVEDESGDEETGKGEVNKL